MTIAQVGKIAVQIAAVGAAANFAVEAASTASATAKTVARTVATQIGLVGLINKGSDKLQGLTKDRVSLGTITPAKDVSCKAFAKDFGVNFLSFAKFAAISLAVLVASRHAVGAMPVSALNKALSWTPIQLASSFTLPHVGKVGI